MKSIIAVLALFAVSQVSAQAVENNNIVTITAPLQGQSYKAGEPAIINWIDPQVDVIPKITFSKGPATLIQPITDIASDVDASLGTYTWTIPATTAPGDDYAFVLGIHPNVSYTGHFSVTGGAGAGNGSATASGSATAAASGASATALPSGASGAPSGSASSGLASGSASKSASASASGSSAANDEGAAVKHGAQSVVMGTLAGAAVLAALL